ncbi:MAG: EamA family transporter [Chthoniobacterales bacterium]
MTAVSAALILTSLVAFIAGQLLLKRGMEATRHGWRQPPCLWLLTTGIGAMAVSFFLTVGLLQRFDLSYLYPFQGLSVIILAALGAITLREKITLPLAIGSLLISAGVVLVSLS